MKRKLFFGLIFFIFTLLGIAFVIANEKTAVFHPKGIIAKEELRLIIINLLLMLSIIGPTFILLFFVVWKYCLKGNKRKYDPDHTVGIQGQILMWLLPSLIVVIMGYVTWNATYALDPYKPIESDLQPLEIQVVALNWKWLFIYPEQEIAVLNFLHIPEKRPIQLHLTADNAPMNSFWVPQLSGQIYSMSGMSTQLHMKADGPGDYVGKEVEINGEGYSDMTFAVKSSTQNDFDKWVNQVKIANNPLTDQVYKDLLKPFVDQSIILFSNVKKDFYQHIVHKYMYPAEPVL